MLLFYIPEVEEERNQIVIQRIESILRQKNQLELKTHISPLTQWSIY